MRTLFTCVVGQGHFNPMVPLARALQAAGHDVAVATDPGFVGHVRHVGFEAFPSGIDMFEAWKRFLPSQPDWRAIEPWDKVRFIVPGLFAGVRVEPMLADLGPLIEAWRPDLLIHDSAEMAGAIAAEAAGIAHAEHSFGILRPPEISRLAVDALAPVCERLGVTNPGIGGIGGELYLDICPPGIQRAAVAELPRVQPLRPVGSDSAPGSVMPDWLAERPTERPLVYVTMGTEFNRDPAIFRAILDGLADEPIDLLVTVGASGDPAALGPIGDHVRVERFVPQSIVLPRSMAFVSHGGSGALMGSLNAGVPILALPQGADQFMNAERIVETGIGLRILPAELTAAAVRDGVRTLLRDERYRRAARSHGPAIAAMPAPEDVVPVLEALVRERAASTSR